MKDLNKSALKKLVDWVLANRRGMAFKDYAPNKIANEIRHAIKQDVFVLSLEDGSINGIACGEKNEVEHYIFIHDVLTLRPGLVKKFILYCDTLHPSFPIYGKAHDRLRLIHNPKQFAKRLK